MSRPCEHRIYVNCDETSYPESWIEVSQFADGVFVVTADNIISPCPMGLVLGYSGWDEEVENMYDEYEIWTILHASDHVRWKDVHMWGHEFHAPSIERLVEALSHVTFTPVCPGDI